MPSIIKPYTLFAAIVALNASGQSLSKEITVDKDVVPQEREASRMVLTPKLVLPAIQQKSLRWSDRGVAASVSPTVATLPPAAYASSITPSPYRGYVMAGYFPAFQIGVSAGYKLIKTDNSDLNVWMQYDGSSVKRKAPFNSGKKIGYYSPDEGKTTYNTQDVGVGVGGSHTFANVGTLSGRVAYDLSSYNFPTLITKGFNQSINRFGVDLGWQSQFGAFDYSVNLGYDYFHLSKVRDESVTTHDFVENIRSATFLDLSSRNEKTLSASFSGRYAISEFWHVGADIDFTDIDRSRSENKRCRVSGKWSDDKDIFINIPPESDYSVYYNILHGGGYNITEMHPYLRWKNDNLIVKAGVGIQIAGGDCGSNRVRPDLRVDWTPSASFAIWGQLNDRRVNMQTLGNLYDRNRYIGRLCDAGPMLDKLHVEGGIVIGPFAGASIELWGSYGRVSSYYTPAVISLPQGNVGSLNSGVSESPFSTYFTIGQYMVIDDFTDMSYGAAFNYDYRDIASLRVSWEGAPQEFDRGNINSLDRARSVFAATLGVHPINPLDISLGYTVRSGRCLYGIKPDYPGLFNPFEYRKYSLGTAASLDLGATWRFSDRFNVWGTVENLLNRDWQIVYGIPNKGVTGLVGVSYRF
ncbi:hypothetical protein [Muribaculum intestinale]|uniref:hypothetical protein n=1 Tax=Muribaculum intestinale TaxID=1796646 RepID=UPI0025A96BDA|nr:hypothetical protein [Muribaculum intestinale]